MSEPSIITREQIDTLRGLLQDVDTPRLLDRRHAIGVIEGLLDRVEAPQDLTVCRNLGCMVVFHATDKCPACHDEPAKLFSADELAHTVAPWIPTTGGES
jgi:hypothetical protein